MKGARPLTGGVQFREVVEESVAHTPPQLEPIVPD